MKTLVLSTGTGGTAVAQRVGADGHPTRICYAGTHDGVGEGLAGVEVVDGWREHLPWADLVVAVGDGWRQWRRAVRQHGRLIFGLSETQSVPTQVPPGAGESMRVLALWNGRRWMDTTLVVVSEHRALSGGYGTWVPDGMGWLAYPIEMRSAPAPVQERQSALEVVMRESDYRGPVTFHLVWSADAWQVLDVDFCARSPLLALLAEASDAPLIDVLSGIAGGTLDAWPTRVGAAVAAQRLSVAPWPHASTEFVRHGFEVAEGAARHLWMHAVGRDADAEPTHWRTDCLGDVGFAVSWGGGDGAPKRRVREALRRVERVASGVHASALQLRSDISSVLGARFGAVVERGALG